MRKLFLLGMVGALLGAGNANATPSLSFTPASGGNGTYTIVLVNDVSGDQALTAFTFGVQRTSGDATITAATRSIPAGAASVGGALTILPDSVFTLGGLSLTGIAAGTYTLGTVTISQGNAASTFVFAQRAGIDDWYAYDSATYTNILINPTKNTLSITAIPEPATASLLGLGLIGLVLAGSRRSRA
jgi:hypothetical protein